MEQETKKRNKLSFWIGLVIVVMAVIFILTREEEFRMWPIPFGIMGMVFIATSGYRLMK